MIPPVVASERGRAQTCHVATHGRGCRTAMSDGERQRKCLERHIMESENAVREARTAVADS